MLLGPRQRVHPNRPRAIRAFETTTAPNDVVVNTTYLYAAAGTSGLKIYSLSGAASTVDTPGTALALALSGNYLYLADGDSGLLIYDISTTPNFPVLVGSYDTATFSAIDVSVGAAGGGGGTTYAYVLGDDTANQNGLFVISVQTPASPTLAEARVTTANKAVTLNSDYVLTLGTTSGLEVWSKYPFNATAIGTVAAVTGGSPQNVISPSKFIAYISDANLGIQVVSLSVPYAPTISQTIVTPATSGLALTTTQLLVGPTAGGVYFYDIEKPLAPRLIERFIGNGRVTSALTVSEGKVYMTEPAANDVLQIEAADVGKPLFSGMNPFRTTTNIFPIVTPSAQTVFLIPFRSSYTGPIYRQKIDFGSVLGSVYLFAPLRPHPTSAIVLYDEQGTKMSAPVLPYGRALRSGLNVSLGYSAFNNKVYLAVGARAIGQTARTFQVQDSGLKVVNPVRAGSSTSQGNVLVKFLPLYSHRPGFVTMIAGQSSSIKTWIYSKNAQGFIQDTTFDTTRIGVSGERLYLK